MKPRISKVGNCWQYTNVLPNGGGLVVRSSSWEWLWRLVFWKGK